MNAVEIEEAISRLAEQPFDAEEFPFAFLEAFGNKTTTIKRLRSGASNKSDLGGVLQINNIHIKVCEEGQVSDTIRTLRESPATKNARNRVKFILATDGITLEAEDLSSDIAPIVCPFEDFPDHFGFFLPLAGISTVKQIRESAFDIKATGRLNRLYIELLKDNPEWGAAERRHDMNHFMARLIFCFFAEDTDIFVKADQFTATIEQMSAPDSTNTHDVISTLFRAMNTKAEERDAANIPRWASDFPYVNGGLFSQSVDVPRFSKIARSYLLHIGNLDWKKINPDIFGSMIQAVADDEERGALGMHYTSVPNILKVLNPLFLDDLREKLEEAGDNARKLLNLRNRMARIRVFDPACGSGNFLVIAYKEMRAIEAEINKRRGEPDRRTDIPLTNFRGIELRDFSAEVARLALIIAEYQCDVLYRGQREALRDFLPLDAMNWITCGNALRLDWLSICPPTGAGVKHHADDLFMSPVEQAEIDFENEGGETYICGNPPYVGATTKAPKGASKETIERLKKEAKRRKDDLEAVFRGRIKSWKSLDYVCGWFMKAADYGGIEQAATAFVATNSVCQGEQVFRFWPNIIRDGVKISFAVTSFNWKNLAARNAGVTVCIVGLSKKTGPAKLFDGKEGTVREVENINAYLVPYGNIYVENRTKPIQGLQHVVNGSKPADGGGLIFDADIAHTLRQAATACPDVIRPFFGAHDATHGAGRYCIWASHKQYECLKKLPSFQERFSIVSEMRGNSTKEITKAGAEEPFSFQQVRQRGDEIVFQIPRHSSEEREFFPIIMLPRCSIVGDGGFAFFDPPLWNISILVSRLTLSWIAAVCGKIKTDYRFSNTLGWNTLPVPKLTAKNKEDLTRCAEDILLAREAHFPATIADLYDPDEMPTNLRAAHDRNDETLERIYIGRRFRNDTERLEKLFELYTRMTKRGCGMSEFNRMTIVAATEVIAEFKAHSDMGVLEVQWDLDQHGISSSSKSARIRDWAQIAVRLNPQVMTEIGQMGLARALVETAILAPQRITQTSEWKKLIAGLRFDGFEIIDVEAPVKRRESWLGAATETRRELRRMLPDDVPETDFREAASEVEMLLEQLLLPVAKGHLQQALSAFQRGEWSSANGELRNFFENYLNEIANALGYSGKDDSKLRRDFLGSGVMPPFLLADYNEWNSNNQKPQYVQGLMSRMHPHGGHPGLSEEEDAAFRLQVSLITARLFLRRFKKRKTN